MQNDKTEKTKLARKIPFVFELFFILTLIAVLVFTFWPKTKQQTLRINNTIVVIELAKTTLQKQQGLCCKNTLPEDQGMLFTFDTAGYYSFWMKDTLIPLDMYWINAEKKIVHIEPNVKPESYPKQYGTSVIAQYVLETNAGYAKRHAIKVGQSVEFEL